MSHESTKNILNPKRNVTHKCTVLLYKMPKDTFFILVKLCMMLLRINAKFEPSSVKRNFNLVDLDVLHDLHKTSASGYYSGEITDLVEKEC